MASPDGLDLVAEFHALLFAAGSIWDVRDRDDEWRLEASFVTEVQARACCEDLNGLEGRERFKVWRRP